MYNKHLDDGMESLRLSKLILKGHKTIKLHDDDDDEDAYNDKNETKHSL